MTTLAFIGGALIAIVCAFLGIEAAGWTCVSARRLVEHAANELPEDVRARYLEEWSRHLVEYDGRPLAMLLHAVGINRSVQQIARELEREAPGVLAHKARRVHGVAFLRAWLGRVSQLLVAQDPKDGWSMWCIAVMLLLIIGQTPFGVVATSHLPMPLRVLMGYGTLLLVTDLLGMMRRTYRAYRAPRP